MGKEAAIERGFAQYAETRGVMALKFVSPNMSGVPDRIVIGNGFSFFIEFKAPGKQPTTLQNRMIQKLRLMSHDVYVCSDLDHAKRILDTYLTGLHRMSINSKLPLAFEIS